MTFASEDHCLYECQLGDTSGVECGSSHTPCKMQCIKVQRSRVEYNSAVQFIAV
jgi:hypothetical protein